jgi:3alpha(or 20beta)-hydroxysteroid dehydrogenase
VIGDVQECDIPGARFVHLDVADAENWASVIAGIGRLDVLVNSAGINLTAAIEDTSEADFRRVVEVNQLGTWLGIRAAKGAMPDGGSIVNIGSIASMTGLADKSAYLSSKWAVRGMTKSLAAELGADGIRVNCVHPGGIETDMTAGIGAEAYEDLPVPRLGTPSEVARAVLFLASDDASYCTGSEIVVDGGKLVSSLATPYQPSTMALPEG